MFQANITRRKKATDQNPKQTPETRRASDPPPAVIKTLKPQQTYVQRPFSHFTPILSCNSAFTIKYCGQTNTTSPVRSLPSSGQVPGSGCGLLLILMCT